MNTKLYLVLSLAFLTQVLHAQETVKLSKAEALATVVNGNLAIKIAEQEVIGAQAQYQQTGAVLIPEISISYTGLSTTNPLMAFGSKLNQEILTPEDFDPALLNDPDRITNYATSIDIRQPLINVDGIYQRKAAKTKLQSLELRALRTKDQKLFQVEIAYMQLQLAYKAQAVLSKAVVAAKANKKIADDNFREGYLNTADVLALEVRVAEVQNRLINAQNDIQNISNQLSFLLGNTSELLYIATDSLTVENAVVESRDISTERSDIKAMRLASDAYLASNKATKMAFLPRLNAFGSYQLYDDQLFQGGANGYIIGAQISWNILEGSKRFGERQKSASDFVKSQLQYEQYVSHNKTELNKAERMLASTQDKLKLTELALKQSRESLRIRRNRFKEGLEKTADLLFAEAQVAEKELNYYQTVYELNYAISHIEFLTQK